MVSVLMIPRSLSSTSPAGPNGRPKGFFLLVAAALLAAACDSVPLLAPSGSTIILTATNNAIAANGTAQLIAQVLEPSGTPPHPGTQVIFTTTLGVVEPGEVETDVNGRAMATFRPNGINGTATIIAASGGRDHRYDRRREDCGRHCGGRPRGGECHARDDSVRRHEHDRGECLRRERHAAREYSGVVFYRRRDALARAWRIQTAMAWRRLR